MIYMLWKECMTQKFHKHICKEKNFLFRNGKNVLQLKVLEIITDFLNKNEENYKDLCNKLSSYKNVFQYVYSNVFPEIYMPYQKAWFWFEEQFPHYLQNVQGQKKIGNFSWEKPWETMKQYEMKPLFLKRRLFLKVDDFNEIEEKEVKEQVKKTKKTNEK